MRPMTFHDSATRSVAAGLVRPAFDVCFGPPPPTSTPGQGLRRQGLAVPTRATAMPSERAASRAPDPLHSASSGVSLENGPGRPGIASLTPG
jgi:hypothetical protein